jgi:hypothetical protein
MKHRKFLRRATAIFCGIIAAYFMTYAALSLAGSYDVVLSDLNHAEFGWVPCGFYPQKHKQPNCINKSLVRVYLSLWFFDQKYIHKNPPPTVYFSEKK